MFRQFDPDQLTIVMGWICGIFILLLFVGCVQRSVAEQYGVMMYYRGMTDCYENMITIEGKPKLISSELIPGGLTYDR